MARAAYRLTAPLLLVALAGCVQPETPEQVTARRVESCNAAGLTPGSDSEKLCLLLQETNERLAIVERRLSFIDSRPLYRPYGSWGYYGP